MKQCFLYERSKRSCPVQLLIFAALFLFTLLPLRAIASGQFDSTTLLETAETDATVEPDDGNDHKALIDTTQHRASNMLLDAAQWFDSFFDDSRYSDEENKSRAKLRILTRYHEEDGFEFSPSIRWRIHLPHLSDRAQILLFAAEDEEIEAKEDSSGVTPIGDTQRDNFAAAIQYFIKTSREYNISTTFGGSFNYLYGGLRFRYYKDFGSWEGRFVERIRYYTDDGWENMVSLDLERHISEKWLFRSSGQVLWQDWEDSIEQTLTFQLYQLLSEKKAISYEWINTFDTEPSHELTDLKLQVRYRQQFYRDWLIFEITPHVNFPEEYDHDPKYGITFSIEAKFGYSEARKLRNIFSF
jgi:hypothetical protein